MAPQSHNRNNSFLLFTKIAAKSLVFTFLWIPVFIFRCLLVYYIANYLPNYGKIQNPFDGILEEDDCYKNPPKSSLIFTLTLDAPLKLSELRQLFTQNVLKARTKNDKGKYELRYPEFMQYQTDLLGYTFWKDDPSFTLKNHIIKLPYNSKYQNISKVHTEMTNKLYEKEKSPWEMILVNNYKNEAKKSLIILRFHHSMGDTKSVLKVIVECLGGKQLSMPNVHHKKNRLLDKIRYYFLMPYYFVYLQLCSHYIREEVSDNPLKFKLEDKDAILSVAISKHISINNIKMIAKANKVTTSAVIMAAVAGGVAKINGQLARKGTPCTWILPEPDHPDYLENHYYPGTVTLPTDVEFPFERLRKCQEIFSCLKSSELYKYNKHSIIFQNGSWFNPFRKEWLKPNAAPLLVTNIAGNREGFSIGSSPVSEFTMSCGPLRGTRGILICGFSYKDEITLAVASKNIVLTERQTQKLTDLIEKEFDLLQILPG